MARRKKQKHFRRRRRSSVSGIQKIDITQLALIAGGAAAASILNKKLSQSENSTVVKLAPFAGIAGGVAMNMFIKSPTMKAIGLGMVGGGSVTALGQDGLKIIGFMNNSIARIAYPGGYKNMSLPAVAGVNQGITRGTRSNFSGSRQSQMNTIAGIVGCQGENEGLY